MVERFKMIRTAMISDLEAVTALERRCFPEAEAAGKAAFTLRLQNFPQTFWLLEDAGKLIAMVNGMTTNAADLCDEMYTGTKYYAADGKWLMLFGVATAPDKQHQGYASELLEHIIETAPRQLLHGIVLTCKKPLIPFYQRFGFVDEGVSESAHGDAVWYQMRLNFVDYHYSKVLAGEESVFCLHEKRYLVYVWVQCDGSIVNVSDENDVLVWQSAPLSGNDAA